MTSYDYIIVDSSITSFNLNYIMQLKQSCNIATKVSSRKKYYYFWSSTWLINVWVNNGEAGHLRHHRAYYDVTVMQYRFVHGQMTCQIWHQWGPAFLWNNWTDFIRVKLYVFVYTCNSAVFAHLLHRTWHGPKTCQIWYKIFAFNFTLTVD